MIYYISDLHFYHNKIIVSGQRPFNNVDEMNKTLISNWNKTVEDKDQVYFLGDFGIVKNNSDIKNTIDLVKQLNGKITLVYGNHDSKLIKNDEFISLFEDISLYKKINDNGRYVVLMHYPLEVWERSHYGSYHIHGHVHNGKLNHIKNRYNACVEVNNYTPVTLDQMIINCL